MTEETDGAPPPTPENLNTESEEKSNQVLKDEHKEDQQEPKQIEQDNDEEEEEDDDGLPPGWKQSPSPPSSPTLLDMMMNEFPPSSSPLPPTPPLPSSPTDIDMEPQDPEDDGPPPGWDNKYQLNEQVEQLIKPTAVSVISSDVHTEDIQPDAHKEEGEPILQSHTSPPPELASSDIRMEQEDSEDDGPPPGWDSKCQPERELPTACPTIPQSDVKMEDLQKVVSNEGQPTPEIPLDIKVDQQDSEDEGPPPGWDSKCQLEPKLQSECPATPQLDIKMEDVQLDARNEIDTPSQMQSESHTSPAPELVPSGIKLEEQDSEDDGPPPGWDSKCQLEPRLQVACPTIPPSDIKMEHLQQSAQDEDVLESQVQAYSSRAPEQVASDGKVKEQNLDDGEPKSQMSCPTTPPSDLKMHDDHQDEEGPPPGWGSTPEQQSQVRSSLPSPIAPLGAKIGYEQNDVKVAEEILQPPSTRQSIPPTKPQMSVPKLPMLMDNPEMGQMVCGSCRHLLSYPRGARYVECACCLEENYVLEEHEVGQVVCGGCNVLLMYPYGAPKVRCVNCSAETEIGDQNRRPPLSGHQSRARRHFKRVQLR